jgi:hypothetical protein
MLIEHIVEQVWTQYDYDKNNILDEQESYDFIKEVLTQTETFISNLLRISP